MSRQLAASIALLSLATAHAAGPMVTQSADVLDRGDCRGEALWGKSEFRSSWMKADGTDRGLALACGIGWGPELNVGVARSNASAQVGTDLYRLGGDTRSLSGKTRLWQSDNRSSALTLTYLLSEQDPRGGGSEWQRANRAVGLAYSQTLSERHRVHANLTSDVVGYGSNEKAEAWGLAYEFAVTPILSLLAETYGKQHLKPTQALGLRWTPTPNWELGAMAARPRGENGHGTKSHEVRLTTAYRF
ncbi:MAG: hypothetical protein ACK520_17495 [Inhella sp.]